MNSTTGNREPDKNDVKARTNNVWIIFGFVLIGLVILVVIVITIVCIVVMRKHGYQYHNDLEMEYVKDKKEQPQIITFHNNQIGSTEGTINQERGEQGSENESRVEGTTLEVIHNNNELSNNNVDYISSEADTYNHDSGIHQPEDDRISRSIVVVPHLSSTEQYYNQDNSIPIYQIQSLQQNSDHQTLETGSSNDDTERVITRTSYSNGTTNPNATSQLVTSKSSAAPDEQENMDSSQVSTQLPNETTKTSITYIEEDITAPVNVGHDYSVTETVTATDLASSQSSYVISSHPEQREAKTAKSESESQNDNVSSTHQHQQIISGDNQETEISANTIQPHLIQTSISQPVQSPTSESATFQTDNSETPLLNEITKENEIISTQPLVGQSVTIQPVQSLNSDSATFPTDGSEVPLLEPEDDTVDQFVYEHSYCVDETEALSFKWKTILMAPSINRQLSVISEKDEQVLPSKNINTSSGRKPVVGDEAQSQTVYAPPPKFQLLPPEQSTIVSTVPTAPTIIAQEFIFPTNETK